MRANAPKRSSVAANTPPISRSHTSVVVRSIAASSSPESASFSIERPPVPVAWNTRHSARGSSRSASRCTAVVVTPNMVSPTAGLSPGRARPPSVDVRERTMPASAWAALPSTSREIRLSPCTSVTEYIIKMSEAPT